MRAVAPRQTLCDAITTTELAREHVHAMGQQSRWPERRADTNKRNVSVLQMKAAQVQMCISARIVCAWLALLTRLLKTRKACSTACNTVMQARSTDSHINVQSISERLRRKVVGDAAWRAKVARSKVREPFSKYCCVRTCFARSLSTSAHYSFYLADILGTLRYAHGQTQKSHV